MHLPDPQRRGRRHRCHCLRLQVAARFHMVKARQGVRKLLEVGVHARRSRLRERRSLVTLE